MSYDPRTTETPDLPDQLKFYYRNKLEKYHVIKETDNGMEVSSLFLKAFNTQENTDLVKDILAECKDEKLSYAIRMGGCLRMFGIERDDLFHCLNLMLWEIDGGIHRKSDSIKLLKWIDHVFNPTEMKEMSIIFQSTLDKLSMYRKKED